MFVVWLLLLFKLALPAVLYCHGNKSTITIATVGTNHKNLSSFHNCIIVSNLYSTKEAAFSRKRSVWHGTGIS